jgi:hypothetical protein
MSWSAAAARLEPPFEHVALDDERARHLALAFALRGGPGVDDERAGRERVRGLDGRETAETGGRAPRQGVG